MRNLCTFYDERILTQELTDIMMQQNSANWINRQFDSLYYEESKFDWNIEVMSTKLGIERKVLAKCKLLGGWFGTHGIQECHVAAVAENLKERATFEIASALLNIIGQIDLMPSILQFHTTIKAVGKAYQKINGPICTDQAIEWQQFLVQKCVSISKQLGILPNSTLSDKELVDKKWEQIVQDDEKLKKAAKNANINIKMLMEGSARTEMKAKWAEVLKTAKKVEIMDTLKGKPNGTGEKLIALINDR